LSLYLDKENKMPKRIIYPTDDGGVAIIVPAPEWLAQEGNTIELLATKDVPEGKPYKIIDTTDVPSDRTFRNAWEYQE
tara:strand:- start:268 stop:501 length:234 start_codon:yes stop_codon:yes gene_type:complete